MRKSFDSLAHLVTSTMASDPLAGDLFVFKSKRGDRIKLLYWDGSGLVLYAKRLEQGGFRWPQITDGVMRLSAVQLSALIAGMEWTRVMAPRRTRTPQEVS